MNVLFLCHRIPFPPNKGDKIRSFNILQRLLKKHTVHVGAFIDDPEDRQHVASLRNLVNGDCNLINLPRWLVRMRMLKALTVGEPLSTAPFSSASLRSWINDLLREGRVDAAIIFGTAMAPYFLRSPMLRPCRVIFDMVDIDSDKWRQFADDSSGLMRLIYKRESKKLLELERKAAGQFSTTLLVSPVETETFSRLAPEAQAALMTSENGVDLTYFRPGGRDDPFREGGSAIVMVGRMDYRPNAEGARWFIERVLPLIRRSRPGAKFCVVGARPPQWLRAMANEPAITVTGSVPDVRPYLAHASVVVAPLHQARGVQNKVLEAMAMGKVVVATTPATRALKAKDQQDLFIADAPDSFASTVLRVLGETTKDEVGASARRYVEMHHSWEENLAVFDRLLAGEHISWKKPNPHLLTTDLSRWAGL